MLKRCKWVNLNNPLYIKYHDEEWGHPNHNDHYLFEILTLEIFVAGLSWECVLNKREAFRKAYDNFEIDKVISYPESKIDELMTNENIIRHRLKIKASINNALVFKKIQTEFGSFDNYLCTYSCNHIYKESNMTSSPLSDAISKDLKARGMKFVGTTTIYAFLQAVGIVDGHDDDCFFKIIQN